jgi:hypothetical protein
MQPIKEKKFPSQYGENVAIIGMKDTTTETLFVIEAVPIVLEPITNLTRN